MNGIIKKGRPFLSPEKRMVTLHIRLKPEVRHDMEHIAADHGITISTLAQIALADWLRYYKSEADNTNQAASENVPQVQKGQTNSIHAIQGSILPVV